MSRKQIDWEAVEADYRAGMLSLREIAEAHGVSHVMISKKAKAMGWVRDLKAKIQAKADDLVNKALVNSSVSKVNEVAIVEAVAIASATVQISQRSDIRRARAVNMALLDLLEAQIANIPELEHLGEIMRAPNENGQDKQNDIYRAVIALPEMTKTMKAWTESFKALAILEREAYGIVVEPPKVAVEVTEAPRPDDVARRLGSLLDRPEVAASILARLQAHLAAKKE